MGNDANSGSDDANGGSDNANSGSDDANGGSDKANSGTEMMRIAVRIAGDLCLRAFVRMVLECSVDVPLHELTEDPKIQAHRSHSTLASFPLSSTRFPLRARLGYFHVTQRIELSGSYR